MSATASPVGEPGNTIDDDATTRWTSGTAQQPGQWVQVDLGGPQKVRRVVLDTGVDVGDFPRGYALSTSKDGSHWNEPVATGAGQGQLTTIDIAATGARFLRVVQTATAPQWWSIADLRVYR
jgi:glucosylceramidase